MAGKGGGSKNNIENRQKQKDIMFNGKIIVPVKFIGNGRKFIAAQYKDNSQLVEDTSGEPMAWADAASANA